LTGIIRGLEELPGRMEPYEKIDGDVVEDCDVCVIGSGAAGAVIANKLARAGRSVVLLEKGGYYEGEDMNQRDEEMVPLLWKNGGINFTDDLRIAIGQGCCLGGSTVINDAVCFSIPEIVAEQWNKLGVRISRQEWGDAIKEVSDQIHVTPLREDELNRNSRMLRTGCELLGFKKHSVNSRNCIDCMQCGLCHLGCHYETKQDMRVTYIHRALSDPGSEIRVYVNCAAGRITHAGGIVDGVEGSFLDSSGKSAYKMRVNARALVLSAGAIASSQILISNSIAPGVAGRGLALHPFPCILGDFQFEVKGNQGIPMEYALHEFGVTNGVADGGFLVEGIYLPPLQFAMYFPESGLEKLELMKRYDHYAMAGVLVRDDQNGTVSVTGSGTARVSYSPGAKELEAMAQGTALIARMWFAQGASRVITSHLAKRVLYSVDEVDELANAIRNDPKNLLLGSAHPQGGNRMGSDGGTFVVDSDCRVYGFKNLFVCDASVFPTALGVNPQLTVMSLATITADRLTERWDEVTRRGS
jgi:choline dehydrogenase-like flavoprotein